MPDRAVLSLIERAARLEREIDSGDPNAGLIVELILCHVERGELGAALRRADLLDLPSHGEANAVGLAVRAWCGDEDGALGRLAAVTGEGPGTRWVRARVAASRGDWVGVRAHVAEGSLPAEVAPDASLLAARASLELGDADEARAAVDALEMTSPWSALEADVLRARIDAAGTPVWDELTARARAEGAVRVEAEAWADHAMVARASGDPERERRAAERAVDLWDDMATTLPPALRSAFWSDARRRALREPRAASRTHPGTPPDGRIEPLLRSLARLASERDVSKLLDLITDGAVSLASAERGFVLLVDDAGRLEPRTVRGAEERLGRHTAAFSRSIAEAVLIDGEPIITVDATEDARVQDYLSVHQLMLKSVACVPIRARDRTWGVLYLEHRSARGRFTGADLTALRGFADQAAIAIETAHLFEQVEAQKRALEDANAALQEANARLEERIHGQAEVLVRTRREVARLKGPGGASERWGLVGMSEAMEQVAAVVDRVAANIVPLVITGESGTGKELAARAVHRAGPRSDGPFVSVSCGAVPEGLLESELFGHVAGAFTGATHARDGLFVQAEGGTLFLDEIEDMPPRMQLDLLRVLQARRVQPVGASIDRPVDVRVIAASKRRLADLVADGSLREDLYYRLAVVELALPPLRERRGDIPLLCDHFLRRIAEQRSEPVKRLGRSARERLGAHHYPGNVRELEHLLLNATVFCEGTVIQAEDLAIEASPQREPEPEDAGSYQDYKLAERDRIVAALNAHGWNRARAARALGMPRRTFYRRLKQHGIELPG